jgi:hypothetical protein
MPKPYALVVTGAFTHYTALHTTSSVTVELADCDAFGPNMEYTNVTIDNNVGWGLICVCKAGYVVDGEGTCQGERRYTSSFRIATHTFGIWHMSFGEVYALSLKAIMAVP